MDETTTGIRLRAARLAAGFATVTQLVTGTDIHRTTWRSGETDHRPIGAKMRALIGEKLMVSGDYIFDDKIDAPEDAVAADVAAVLLRAASEETADIPLAASRLKRMRLASGYTVIRKACAEFGWVSQTYSAHENARLPIPVDQAISYALAYGYLPGELLFPAQESSEDIDNASWKWLSRSDDPCELTVLHMGADRMVLADHLRLPARMLRGRPGVFGVVDNVFNDEEILLLVRATDPKSGPVLMMDGDVMSIAEDAPAEANYGDPTLYGASRQRPAVIGHLIGTLKYR